MYPKPPKFRQRGKDVTLISAFRCNDERGQNAFVVSAESQETQGDYRFYLEKLDPIRTGNFELVIGGSGFGELVEAFHLRLTEVLKPKPASVTTMEELKQIIKTELLDFLQVEVEAFPARKNDKYTQFLIAAFGTKSHECECWLTRATQLKPVKTFQIIGMESPLYKDIAKRMHSHTAGISQTVRLALHVMMVAKRTCNFADGPTSLFVIRNDGIWEDDAEYIVEAERHIAELSVANDALSVALPDMGLAAIEFEAALQDFVDSVRSIRRTYMQSAAAKMLEQIRRGEISSNRPYRKFPEGGSFMVDTIDGKSRIVQVGDNPHIGRHLGHFDKKTGDFVSQHTELRFCGRKRVVGNRVFAQVVPCKLRAHQNPTENCIEDKWLETLSAKSSEDQSDTQ